MLQLGFALHEAGSSVVVACRDALPKVLSIRMEEKIRSKKIKRTFGPRLTVRYDILSGNSSVLQGTYPFLSFKLLRETFL